MPYWGGRSMAKEQDRIAFLERQLEDWVDLCHKQNGVIEKLAIQLQELLTVCEALKTYIAAHKSGKEVPSA